VKIDLDEYCTELEAKLEDKETSESLVRTAAYVSLGLGIINVALILFLGFLILRGTV
jgi:hypothetical protein